MSLSFPLKYRGLFLCALLSSVILLSVKAYALIDDNMYTEAEKVGFAFHKLGNIEPDFMTWIKSKNEYKTKQTLDKHDFIRTNILRLETGFRNYTSEDDHLKFTIPAEISFGPAKTLDKYGQIGYDMNINFTGDDSGFLAINIGDIWVAVVMQALESFQTIDLSQGEYEDMQTLLAKGSQKTGPFQTYANIVLKPVSVDVSAPMVIDNTELWLMLSEIASLRLENTSERRTVWDYRAEWYVSDEQIDLLNLYE